MGTQAFRPLQTAVEAMSFPAHTTMGVRPMNMMQLVRYAALVFVLVLVVTMAVISLFGFSFHGEVTLNWQVAFTFAISLGIALPLIRRLEKKKKPK
jgi:hypothetical protein